MFSPNMIGKIKKKGKPLNDNIAKTVLHGFIETMNEFKRKPNKSWVDPGGEFYNDPVQKW